MTDVIRFFSARVSDAAKRTLLEALVHVSAKKLVLEDGAFIYMVEGKENCDWVERSIRMIVGADNYLRFDRLPPDFLNYAVYDVTL